MAPCDLCIDDDRFTRAQGRALTPAVASGLEKLRSKVARERSLSHWVCQPMPGIPELQGKIWKWDFAPDGDRSSTRPGWRAFALVHNPDGPGPIRATIFWIYPKPEPKGNAVQHINEALRRFLAGTVAPAEASERFKRQTSDGEHRSTCLRCCETVAVSRVLEEIELAEAGHHDCDPSWRPD